MSVLVDYFRAGEPAAVVEFVGTAPDGGPATWDSSGTAADVVDAAGVDPAVILGRLVALALDAAQIDAARTDVEPGRRLVWPTFEDRAEVAAHAGPWVELLDDRSRDALAGVCDEDVPALAARWSHTVDLAGYGIVTPECLLGVVRDLVGLARRARDVGEHLHAWTPR